MKKTIAIAALLMLFAGAFCAKAQNDFSFGVKGGIAGNWLPGTTIEPDDRVSANFGFYGGVTGALDFSYNIMMQAELMYSRKGVNTTGALYGNKYERRLHYLQLPVMVVVKLADENLRLMAGPELNYCLGTKVYQDAIFDPTSAVDYNRFGCGLVIQASYLVAGGLGVDFKVDYGLTKALKEDDGRILSLQLGLSYTFGL